MRILVTGYKGFIGQNTLKALSGYDVNGYEFGDPFPRVQIFDRVIHLGAISSTTEQDVEKVMVQNYDFSVMLLKRCNEIGIPFQYSSSASVYGLKAEFKEDSPVNPRSPYSWSKYLFDRYVLNNTWDITVQGFRYFNVYGPHEDHKGDQASPYYKFTQQAKTLGVIKLFEGSDKYLRDFVPVETVVDIHKKFLTIPETGIWNIGTGKAKSFQQVAEEIASKYNARIEYIPMPDNVKQHYQTFTQADLTKLNDTLRRYSS
jgi:ADP-L-glycero-D-manno-heptose 6-epimerase